MKSKDIIFYPSNEKVAMHIDPPMPSSSFIPDWYKNVPKYSDRSNRFKNNGGANNNLTVKSCLPVVDSLTSGYMITLPHDIQVSRENNLEGPLITWAFNVEGIGSFIRKRPDDANNCAWENIDGYDPLTFSWMPAWSIKTPKGYSCIFTHPINRVDLPFYTLGGIMDTDGWGDAGNHPFLFKKGWEGIIPAGTPIIQIIPFKRDNWISKAKKDMTEEYKIKIADRDKKLKDYYKTTFWKNKSYK